LIAQDLDFKEGSILIIADDLTGAADSAVPFRQAGFSTVVLSGTPRPRAARHRTQVTSLSLNTREASPAAVKRIWARHAPTMTALAQNALVYQKIDSTLRGHAALEVGLLLNILGASAALIAPAFPKLGRQTLDGVQRVDGVPLAETGYARGRGRVQPTSHLGEIFTATDGQPPVHLPLKAINQGAEHIATVLREYLGRTCQLITADATDERHLDTLTQAALPLAGRLLLVGSAGWAERLALACRGQRHPQHAQPGVLAIVGSLSSVATRQVQVASDGGAMVVRFSLADLPYDWRTVAQTLLSGGHALLWTNTGEHRPSSGRAGQRVLRALALRIREILATTPVSGLTIVGGETAQAVLQAMHASGIALAGECLPGVPYGRLLDGPFAGLPIATKAGGFGMDTTLHDCLQFMHQWASQ